MKADTSAANSIRQADAIADYCLWPGLPGITPTSTRASGRLQTTLDFAFISAGWRRLPDRTKELRGLIIPEGCCSVTDILQLPG